MKLFEGAILLQARSVPRAKSIAELPFGPTARLPKEHELSEFLSLLTLIAMGNGLRYDPTVPEEDVNRFLESSARVGLTAVRPLTTPAKAELIDDVQRAFAMSLEWLDDVIQQSKSPGHQQMDSESVAGFFGCVLRMAAERERDNRIAIAFDAYNSGQRGGKLLVGLAAQEDRAWLDRIASAAALQNQEHLMSALINLFRPFLLSSWAGKEGAVFAGPDDAIQRLHAHQLAFWKEFEAELVRRGRLNLPTYQQEALAAPMIGVVLLMTAPRTMRPIELFQWAVEAREYLRLRELADTFWRIQFDASASKGRPLDALRNAVEKVWDRVTTRGGPKREQLNTLGSEVTAVVTPAAGVGLATAAAGLLAGAALPEVLAVLGAGVLATAIFESLRLAQQRDTPAAVISNLIALDQDAYHLVEERVHEMWRAPST